MNETKKIYITVGSRFFGTYVKKIEIIMSVPDVRTDVQIAKTIRKSESVRLCIKPSELYWAIFDNLDDEKPRIHSKNYIQGNLVSVSSFMIVGV